ncbi:pirin family protein [Hahella aquimaris]|uniref:pirin family protein n=1 Tax=Hahella sp. HNIBRBA332 TaxID=3015983 RepID=UPI00273C0772|nr:pirin family protein [Hahella sp. HNIBRBA332]WLQ11918.1 pirin family protein [Hahella sp. HNIBRBA332]
MSNLTKQNEYECDVKDGCGAIQLIIEPREKDLGGFSVRRTLPTAKRKMVGPWIFFDHMGPANFPAGDGVSVRPHPHIGIATVTYLFDGEILHRDSLGSVQPIQPRDINLMVAGRGIVHSERERPEIRNKDHSVHGLQLWLALPEDQEEIEPAFYHYPGASIPQVTVDGVDVRIMMGSACGVASPVKVFAETLYLEAHLRLGQTFKLPQTEERAVYVAQGELNARDNLLPQYAMAFFSNEPDVTLEATQDTRLVLIGGESFNKRFIDWNFVSSRKERIEQAKQDWKSGRFPKVPEDEEEFIPLPE